MPDDTLREIAEGMDEVTRKGLARMFGVEFGVEAADEAKIEPGMCLLAKESKTFEYRTDGNFAGCGYFLPQKLPGNIKVVWHVVRDDTGWQVLVAVPQAKSVPKATPINPTK